jgi:hypothetical protein
MNLENLSRLGQKVFERYKRRNFEPETLDLSKKLLLRLYDQHQHGTLELGAAEYRALASGVEVVDSFNAMDAALGAAEYGNNKVYSWIRRLSERTCKRLAEQDLHPRTREEAEMLIYRIRLAAGGFANELYRDSHYVESLSEFRRLIKKGEQLLSYLRGHDLLRELVMEAEDMLCYLEFSAGKAARQNRDGDTADLFLRQSSDYLLSSALALTDNSGGQTPDPDHVERAHFMLSRIGVVEVARAWNFVFQGKMDAAAESANRASRTVASSDKQNKMLAQSIIGIVERTRAGRDPKLLDAAIKKLKGSYDFFLEPAIPRYAVRCLCELEIAFVIGGRLDDALDILKGFAAYITPGHNDFDRFKKITGQPRWSGQLRLVKSRIARKAAMQCQPDEILEFISELDRILEGRRGTRSGDPSSQALQLAIEEACIAENSSDRTVQMDAMVCHGEALMAMKDYSGAQEVFLRLLRETGIQADVDLGKPQNRQQFEMQLRNSKDEPHFTALPLIYLARVAMTRSQLELCAFFLEQSKSLLHAEHKWLSYFWEKGYSDFQELSRRRLVVDLENHAGLKDLEIRFRAALEERFHILDTPINQLSKEFDVSDSMIKRLRVKIRNERKPKQLGCKGPKSQG